MEGGSKALMAGYLWDKYCVLSQIPLVKRPLMQRCVLGQEVCGVPQKEPQQKVEISQRIGINERVLLLGLLQKHNDELRLLILMIFVELLILLQRTMAKINSDELGAIKMIYLDH